MTLEELEELIPDDWSPEQAETIADGLYEIADPLYGIADGLYEIADAIMTVHGLAIRELWRERNQWHGRGPEPEPKR